MTTKNVVFVDSRVAGYQTFIDSFRADTAWYLLDASLDTATVDASGWHDTGKGPGSSEGHYINWLTIADNAASVVEDVKRIRAHPLVPGDVPVYGYIYDCKTGRLMEIPEATEAGRAA